ncbi:MAG: hypothetical protein ACREVH_01550 [Gammaproteobacteria bacterium]
MTAQFGMQQRHKPGLSTLRNAVKQLARRADIADRRTAVGRALAEWRAEVIAEAGAHQKGGPTAQQIALADVAMRSKLLLDSVDYYLVNMDSLVNKHKRQLWPIVVQRTTLADAFIRQLEAIGVSHRIRSYVDDD